MMKRLLFILCLMALSIAYAMQRKQQLQQSTRSTITRISSLPESLDRLSLFTAQPRSTSPPIARRFLQIQNDDVEAAQPLLLRNGEYNERSCVRACWEQCSCKRCTCYCLCCTGTLSLIALALFGCYYLGNHGCSTSRFADPPRPAIMGSGGTRALVMRK